MWPNNRGRRDSDKEKMDQSVAYDKVLNDDKLDRLVMIYDEKSVILFGNPKSKAKIKRV